MNCIRFEELAMLYFDGTADEQQYNELMEHAENCGSCRESFEGMKKVIEMLDEHEDFEIDKEFTAGVMAKVNEYEENRVNTQRLLERIIYPLSAAFVLTGVFFWMYIFNNVNMGIAFYRFTLFARIFIYSAIAALKNSNILEYINFINSQLHYLLPLTFVIIGISLSSDYYKGKRENNI